MIIFKEHCFEYLEDVLIYLLNTKCLNVPFSVDVTNTSYIVSGLTKDPALPSSFIYRTPQLYIEKRLLKIDFDRVKVLMNRSRSNMVYDIPNGEAELFLVHSKYSPLIFMNDSFLEPSSFDAVYMERFLRRELKRSIIASRNQISSACLVVYRIKAPYFVKARAAKEHKSAEVTRTDLRTSHYIQLYEGFPMFSSGEHTFYYDPHALQERLNFETELDSSFSEIEYKQLQTRSCKAARKLGQYISSSEATILLQKAASLHYPWKCCHGRNTFGVVKKK